MVIDKKESYELYNIFLSQRLSKPQSISLISEMTRLETLNGIAFLVKRLKLIKAALLSGDLSGLRLNAKGSVSGPFGILFRKAKLSRKEAIRMDRVSRVYGRWVSKPATQEQWVNYRSSIWKRFNTPYRISISDQDLKTAKHCLATFQEHIPLSDVKKSPFLGGVTKDATPEDHFYSLLDYCPQLVFRHRGVFKHLWKAQYTAEMVLMSKGHHSFWDHHTEVAGKICCLTKDRGLKLRFIANPLIGLQLATSRLQKTCDLFLQRLPESCVHDQLSVVEWAVPKLKNGEVAWSIDLTSATDSFPLSIQVHCLKTLFPHLIEDINLFADISRLDWETPIGPVHFGTGQPMGLSPSFAAFSISHTLLIRSLGGNSDNFRTCGDDVVIFDEKLAKAYIEVLQLIGVEISLSKSLMGKCLVEFAGRLIDKHGVWRSFKASPLKLSTDPLGLVRQYGLNALLLYPKDVRPLVSFLSRLPLIGLPGYEDRSLLEHLDVDLVELLFFLREMDNFPVPIANPKISSFGKEKSIYDGYPLQESIVGIGVRNNPILVDHVLANTPKTILDSRTEFVEHLARDLIPGFSPVLEGAEEDNKYPLSRLKRFFKSIKPF
jgi:hypothetical protein